MKTPNYILLALSVILLTACEETSEKKPLHELDPDFKKTFLQGGEGSYWIYVDSVGDSYDTVTLTSSKRLVGAGNFESEVESYDQKYTASNTGNFATYLGTFLDAANKPYYTFSYNHSAGHVYDIDLKDGKYLPEGSVKKQASVVRLGKTYNNVTQVGDGALQIIDPAIGVVYKEQWSPRPNPGIKKYYQKEHELK